MNYRHGYHAGNFCDVFKHAMLARILEHLCGKDTAFRVIDTHAGAGAHDLSGEAASRTREWEAGIGRLAVADLPAPVAVLLESYVAQVRKALAARPPIYPGSPELALAFSRPQDRFVFCEKHPDEARLLKRHAGRDSRVTVVESDGWRALETQVPPRERRGLVLIDPPFEDPREFSFIVEGLREAHRRWATGVYAIWYPIKARRAVEAFARKLVALRIPRILRAELGLYRVERIDRLNGCGMIVVNPPWKLEQEWRLIGPTLASILAVEGPGTATLEWLAGEEKHA
jgi:23S rRNA (adenine2030-N6)-methyltransferase